MEIWVTLWWVIGVTMALAMFFRAGEKPIWIVVFVLALFGPILVPVFFFGGLCALNGQQEKLQNEETMEN